MAGLGRRTHYRKHLTDSIIYDFPEPSENERIAKVVATRGSNQFDIILAKDTTGDEVMNRQREPQLAILPTKFNKLVWVKRNDFVIVETAGDEDAESANEKGGSSKDPNINDGIRYMISHILYKDQVKHLQDKGLWPKIDEEFSVNKVATMDLNVIAGENREEDDHEVANDGIVYDDMLSEDDDYFVNSNRLAALEVDDSSDSEASREEEV